MKIGLLDIDSHAKVKKWGATVYPNLALCKIAAYHKQRGDDARNRYKQHIKGWLADVVLEAVSETKYMDYFPYNNN